MQPRQQPRGRENRAPITYGWCECRRLQCGRPFHGYPYHDRLKKCLHEEYYTSHDYNPANTKQPMMMDCTVGDMVSVLMNPLGGKVVDDKPDWKRGVIVSLSLTGTLTPLTGTLTPSLSIYLNVKVHFWQHEQQELRLSLWEPGITDVSLYGEPFAIRPIIFVDHYFLEQMPDIDESISPLLDGSTTFGTV